MSHFTERAHRLADILHVATALHLGVKEGEWADGQGAARLVSNLG
jgi:hypothetical protein